MMFIGLFWLVAVLLLVRWLMPAEAGRALPGEARRVEAEVERLREEVDRLSGQVQRLLDEQSFLLRLLEGHEGPAALGRGAPPEADERADRLPPAEPPDRNPIH